MAGETRIELATRGFGVLKSTYYNFL